MDDLLKYYELELATLNHHNREFAERYPMIAGRLGISDANCRDPHIDRMIQAYAMFNARTAKRLDDSARELTEALLEVNYPHYLRPFPSCAIARFDNSGSTKIDRATLIPRGTPLHAPEQDGVICKFSTAYDVTLAPLRLAAAGFTPAVNLPPSAPAPRDAWGVVHLTLETGNASASLDQLEQDRLRLFIDAPPSLTACLRDALLVHARAAWLQTEHPRWQALARTPLAAVGFAADEALLPFKPSSHPAYRLLTEYFAFPDKFNFIDLELASWRAALPAGCRRAQIHLVLCGAPLDAASADILRPLSKQHLLSGCTPVVNLFRQAATPIRLTHASADYPLLVETRHAHAYDIYSIDSVQISKPDGGARVFHPYYSMRHGEAGGARGRYWLARRDETMARSHPGYETRIAFSDLDLNPLDIGDDTVSIELSCTNRDFPSRLPHGAADGDLKQAGAASALPIRLLRKPSPAHRFRVDAGTQWRLISQLSLNHHSLVAHGVSTLKEMLQLYNLPGSAVIQRQIDAIHDLRQRSASVWFNGGLVYGIDVLLTVDEQAFVGSGLHAFTQVLEHVFGMYVHLNSYTRLIVLSLASGKELIRCKPLSGDQSLA